MKMSGVFIRPSYCAVKFRGPAAKSKPGKKLRPHEDNATAKQQLIFLTIHHLA
jgi:hypothetical protein